MTCDTFTVRTSLTWGHRGGQSRVCRGSRVGSTQQWSRVMCWGQRRVARDLVTRRVVPNHAARQENPIREGQSGATGPGVVGTRCTQGHRSMGSNPRCSYPHDRGRTRRARRERFKKRHGGGARCERWWVLGGWGMVVFGYVGMPVHVSNPPCKLPPHEPRDGTRSYG